MTNCKTYLIIIATTLFTTAYGRETQPKTGAVQTAREESFFIEGDDKLVDLRKSVMIATAKDGSKATAFFGKIKSANFIITNAKIKGDTFVSEFHLYDGQKVARDKKGFIAADRDVYIIPAKEIPEGAYSLPVALKVNEFIRLGDEVRILGNHGSNDFYELQVAKIRSIGPFQIDLDVKNFDVGSSGSPVIHVASGTCIGIISHSFERIEYTGRVSRSRGADKNYKVRYYVLRLDADFEWMPLSNEKMEFLNTRVKDVYEIVQVCDFCINKCLSRCMSFAQSSHKNCSLPSILGAFNEEELALLRGCPDINKIINIYEGEVSYSGMSNAKAKKILREYFNNFERYLFSLKAQLRSSEIDKYLPSDAVTLNRRIDNLMELCKQTKSSRALQ